MSQIQTFANNHSTQFARVLAKLIAKHIAPNPQLTAAFNQFNHTMYLHRVLYAYHKYSIKHSRLKPSMQARFVLMLRKNPQQLVTCANTPTAYM
jgi:hypothetical protein